LHSLDGFSSFLCHSIGFYCNFCFPFRLLTDLPSKFYKSLKLQNLEPFLAIFISFSPNWTGTIPKLCSFLKPQHKLVLHRCKCHYLKFGEDLSLYLQNPTGCFSPKVCRNGKWAIRQLITLKWLKIMPYNLRVESIPESLFSLCQTLHRPFRGFSKITCSIEVPPSRQQKSA